MTTIEMSARIVALEAAATRHIAENERVHRVVERLANRLSLAEARAEVAEHRQRAAPRGPLPTEPDEADRVLNQLIEALA